MSHATPSEPTTRRALTLAEWGALDEDEPGELVDGVLVEEEVPDYVHELVVAWLIGVLGTWAEPRTAGLRAFPLPTSPGRWRPSGTRGPFP
jgi:Uma2 family endonuclease